MSVQKARLQFEGGCGSFMCQHKAGETVRGWRERSLVCVAGQKWSQPGVSRGGDLLDPSLISASIDIDSSIFCYVTPGRNLSPLLYSLLSFSPFLLSYLTFHNVICCQCTIWNRSFPSNILWPEVHMWGKFWGKKTVFHLLYFQGQISSFLFDVYFLLTDSALISCHPPACKMLILV